MGGTAWYSFTSKTLADADQVNANFDWMEGDFVPHKAGDETANAYDLGTGANAWRSIYLENSIVIAGQTITAADNSTLEFNNGDLRIKQQGVRGSTANSGGSAQELALGQVSTANILDNALTLAVDSGAGGTVSGSPMNTLSITTATQSSLLLIGKATLNITGVAGPTGTFSIEFEIDRNSTSIAGGVLHVEGQNPGILLRQRRAIKLSVVDAPGAGGQTYRFRMNRIIDTTVTIEGNCFMFTEFRK